MKLISFISLSIFCNILFCQSTYQFGDTLRYSIYISDACSNTITKSSDYELIFPNRNGNEIYLPDSNANCNITKIGHYYAVFNSKSILINSKHVLIDSLDHVDTIYIPPIYISKSGSTKSNYYSYCGSKCNGFVETHRENGQVWQRGKFNNGRIQELTIYSPNGTKQMYYSRRMISERIKIFSEKGILSADYFYFLFYSKLRYSMEPQSKFNTSIKIGGRIKDFVYY